MSKINKKIIALKWKPEYHHGTMYMTLNNPIYNVNIPIDQFYISAQDTINEIPKILTWNIDRPDISLILEFINIATRVYKKMSSECLGLLVYGKIDNSFKIIFPNQTVNTTSVTYKPSEVVLDSNDIIIADIHSHHIMKISFSGTDDHDDGNISLVPHISIVVKKIDSVNFLSLNDNIDCRLTIQGTSYNLKLEDIFTDSDEEYYDSFIENHITKYVPPTPPLPATSINPHITRNDASLFPILNNKINTYNASKVIPMYHGEDDWYENDIDNDIKF